MSLKLIGEVNKFGNMANIKILKLATSATVPPNSELINTKAKEGTMKYKTYLLCFTKRKTKRCIFHLNDGSWRYLAKSEWCHRQKYQKLHKDQDGRGLGGIRKPPFSDNSKSN